MKKITIITVLLFSSMAYSQQWNAAQTEVWDVILASYADIEKQDVNWTDKWTTEDQYLVNKNNKTKPVKNSLQALF